MIELPLRIRCSPTPRREPSAWFIPGDDARAWLDEIASWNVKQSSLQLLVVPRSRRDLTPCGVLVLGASKERPSLRCLPYGCAGGRLFLPAEAILDPDVTEHDLSTLLLADTQYVFHPSAGLCAFSAEEVLDLADLLQLPPPREVAWDRAQPGVAFAQRLTSLIPDATPTIEQVLEQGRGDIGSQSNQIRELPRSPNEPSTDPLSRMGRRARQMFAGLVDWLTRQAPATGSSPTWVNRLQNWARRQLAGVHDAWNRERDREILRLMDMLENDPDRGLKYALPIGGEELHRGLAPSGNRLSERDVNFRLHGGGGPADFWALPDDYHRKLVARYRELANRELQLGRHRRAAYIFATLLGDLEAAATALTAGRHWREAAVIYRDKLKRPLEAAKCLERGGLWTEAIALYEELNEFEKAGDLHRLLDQEAEARAMYGKAVAHQSRADDLMGAARLLYEKLHEPDEALEVLELGWPDSRQAQACLGESFRLRGVLGRHADSHTRIERFQRDNLRPDDVAPLVDVLAEQAAQYPDREVRELAADHARVHSAGRLIQAEQDERRRLLSAVERLAPEDRLLPRDCRRFLEKRILPAAPVSRPLPKFKQLRKVGQVMVPGDVLKIAAATQCGDVVYLVGFRGNQLGLIRADAGGDWEVTILAGWSLPFSLDVAYDLILLTGVLGKQDRLTLHIVHTPVIEEKQVFAPTGPFPRPVLAGVQAGISPGLVGAVASAYSQLWTLTQDQARQLSLAVLGPEGRIASTRYVDYGRLILNPEDIPVPMHAWQEHVAICMGLELKFIYRDRCETVTLDRRVMKLCGSPFGSLSLVLTFWQGAALLHASEGKISALEPFATDLVKPVACFLNQHVIAIGSEIGLEVYAIDQEEPIKVAELSQRRSQPGTLLQMNHSRQFAVVSIDGLIEWFEV